MSLRIHLSKSGRHGQRLYRIIVSEKNGKPIDYMGYYHPKSGTDELIVDQKRIAEWIKKGAILSVTLKKLLAEVK